MRKRATYGLPVCFSFGKGRKRMIFDTIAAIATAPGGAIGIIRVSGGEAVQAVGQVFRPASGKAFADCTPRMLVYGSLLARDGRVIDQCMAVQFPGDKTYTGEPTAELQLHGSPAVLGEALSALFHAGARQAEAGEFTRRAFLNGKLGLMEAEAVADLIASRTMEAAENAAGQLTGAVGGRMAALRQGLVGLSAHFLAVVDYPDEDIDPFLQQEAERVLTETEQELTGLYDSYERGRILREGLPCAIVGRPNVGKSTLLNALVGFDRAIVTDIAGTTRDTIEETVRIGPLCLRLQDTAGLRETADPVEKIGVQRAAQAAESAGLVLAVIDGSAPLTAEDEQALARAKAAPRSVLVVNKCDKADTLTVPEGFRYTVRISAKHGEGLETLRKTLLDCAGLEGAAFDGGVITNARQADALRRAADCCGQARRAAQAGFTPDAVLMDVEGAIAALGELTGQNVREDIIQDIFSRFCVGK